MRILVLDVDYPSTENLYGDVFVHVRVARYLALGHNVRVVAFFRQTSDYTFDGVPVSCAPDLDSLRRLMNEFEPDVVAVHFFQGWMLDKLFKRLATPVIVWVHGMEALGWYRRLFNFELTAEFWQYVKYSTIQMVRFRRLVSYARRNPERVRFVFVSDWMRRLAETDSLSRVHSYDIIPNPIDDARFPYVPKDASARTRVLLIRSFDSRKYANDIAIDGILRLMNYPEFANFQFAIHGRGKLFDRLTRPIRDLENVTIQEGFLTQAEIRELHATHGIMLCPTRQDAQGVSMCEAMSSGLVPITSRSTAIPEFVVHERTGFLTDGSADIASALRRMHAEPELFTRMSRAAAEDIREKSGIDRVIERELNLMRMAAGKAA